MDDLEKEILKDEIYYGKGKGGVTFSGGEPLAQITSYESLLKSLKSRSIGICFETSLNISENTLALDYADLIYADIKLLKNPSIIGLDLISFIKILKL